MPILMTQEATHGPVFEFLVVFAVGCVRRSDSLRMLNGRPDDDVASIRARNSAADQKNFVCFSHLHDLKILHSHALIAQMARHSHVFPNPARR